MADICSGCAGTLLGSVCISCGTELDAVRFGHVATRAARELLGEGRLELGEGSATTLRGGSANVTVASGALAGLDREWATALCSMPTVPCAVPEESSTHWCNKFGALPGDTPAEVGRVAAGAALMQFQQLCGVASMAFEVTVDADTWAIFESGLARLEDSAEAFDLFEEGTRAGREWGWGSYRDGERLVVDGERIGSVTVEVATHSFAGVGIAVVARPGESVVELASGSFARSWDRDEIVPEATAHPYTGDVAGQWAVDPDGRPAQVTFWPTLFYAPRLVYRASRAAIEHLMWRDTWAVRHQLGEEWSRRSA